MKNLTNLLYLLLIVLKTNSNELNNCILSKLNQKHPKNTLLTTGNLNQQILIQKIKTNYDLLPNLLKQKIDDCKNNIDSIIKKCEKFYGLGNCEKINKFTVGKKCPLNYIRDDVTRCIKNCDKNKKDKKIINYECGKFKSYYINVYRKYNNKTDCLKSHRNCFKDFKTDFFIEDCQANYKRVAFLCIPYCFNEIVGDVKEKIEEDGGFCLRDYKETGIPFYDF